MVTDVVKNRSIQFWLWPWKPYTGASPGNLLDSVFLVTVRRRAESASVYLGMTSKVTQAVYLLHIRLFVHERVTIPGGYQPIEPADCRRLGKNVEAKSKFQAKASHGDFRRFLYEALGKSMP